MFDVFVEDINSAAIHCLVSETCRDKRQQLKQTLSRSPRQVEKATEWKSNMNFSVLQVLREVVLSAPCYRVYCVL